MKKLIGPFIITIAVFILTGCSEKFKITAPYKNITVIYGMLDMADTAHYVRIQKAFLDETKSALTMSKNPDSSFYAGLNVKIKRIKVSDSTITDTIHLNRVDLNFEGYPKQQGVFFDAPNYAYKFKNALDHDYIYCIIVTNLQSGQKDSADAPIIDDNPAHTDPVASVPYFSSYVFTDTGKIDFSSTLANRSYEFIADFIPPANFSFEDQISPAVLAQCIIRFNYADSNYSTHTYTTKSFDYNIGYKQMIFPLGFGEIDYSIPNSEFYNAISSGLGVAPPYVIRLLDKCDIFVYLGTQDFFNYQQNSLVQGVGLTGSEIEPVYTNIKGGDALGLFTSRGMRQGKLKISDNTIDSLILNPITSQANIKGRVH